MTKLQFEGFASQPIPEVDAPGKYRRSAVDFCASDRQWTEWRTLEPPGRLGRWKEKYRSGDAIRPVPPKPCLAPRLRGSRPAPDSGECSTSCRNPRPRRESAPAARVMAES